MKAERGSTGGDIPHTSCGPPRDINLFYYSLDTGLTSWNHSDVYLDKMSGYIQTRNNVHKCNGCMKLQCQSVWTHDMACCSRTYIGNMLNVSEAHNIFCSPQALYSKQNVNLYLCLSPSPHRNVESKWVQLHALCSWMVVLRTILVYCCLAQMQYIVKYANETGKEDC